MKFRPLHDRVLVKRLDEDEKSPGGIIIPDTAKEKPSEGKVVAVGSGTKSEDGKVTALDVKKGDKILFGKFLTLGKFNFFTKTLIPESKLDEPPTKSFVNCSNFNNT